MLAVYIFGVAIANFNEPMVKYPNYHHSLFINLHKYRKSYKTTSLLIAHCMPAHIVYNNHNIEHITFQTLHGESGEESDNKYSIMLLWFSWDPIWGVLFVRCSFSVVNLHKSHLIDCFLWVYLRVADKLVGKFLQTKLNGYLAKGDR